MSGRGPAIRYAPLHPLVQGLLDALPDPEATWPVQGRAKWLQAAASIFDLVYGGDGAVLITVHGAAFPEAAEAGERERSIVEEEG